MLNNLAPIAVSAYSRGQHLQHTIAALQKNTLARQSELFVFSDGPKPGDEDKVEAVRRYLHSVDGFKAVHIVERAENNRLLNNRGGIEYVLDKYGKVIFLEEDVVTAPGFLRFMNDALEFYKDNSRIGSITGYCPPIEIPDSYSKDIFALTMFNGWGCGFWKHYYKMNTPIPKDEFIKLLNDKKRVKRLERSLGEGILRLMQMNVEGKLDAGDMKNNFWQFNDNKLTVYPRKSLTHSTGNDGSGVLMGHSTKWDVSELWDKVDGFEFSQDIDVDERIRRNHCKFYQLGKVAKMIRILNAMGVYKYIRPTARKIRSWSQS